MHSMQDVQRGQALYEGISTGTGANANVFSPLLKKISIICLIPLSSVLSFTLDTIKMITPHHPTDVRTKYTLKTAYQILFTCFYESTQAYIMSILQVSRNLY